MNKIIHSAIGNEGIIAKPGAVDDESQAEEDQKDAN
jgi:hypothetical protein